jgi:hypothetical protein
MLYLLPENSSAYPHKEMTNFCYSVVHLLRVGSCGRHLPYLEGRECRKCMNGLDS